MSTIQYPLKQVLEVKIRRVEDQEKVVIEKRRLLKEEEEKLEIRKQEREKVKKHHEKKLFQLREEMDHGTTSDKIDQMKNYLKVVKEKLVIEDQKVKEQEEQVDLAEKNLKIALHELAQKRLEVDKLEMHKKDWLKEVRREVELKEENESTEQGSVIYSMKKKEREKL
jgi:hypothetical protein